jgi:hypothetical protein
MGAATLTGRGGKVTRFRLADCLCYSPLRFESRRTDKTLPLTGFELLSGRVPRQVPRSGGSLL